jgi:hypothetical protein
MAGANKAAAHGSNVEEDEDMREALKKWAEILPIYY